MNVGPAAASVAVNENVSVGPAAAAAAVGACVGQARGSVRHCRSEHPPPQLPCWPTSSATPSPCPPCPPRSQLRLLRLVCGPAGPHRLNLLQGLPLGLGHREVDARDGDGRHASKAEVGIGQAWGGRRGVGAGQSGLEKQVLGMHACKGGRPWS